jgi:hypothetical protein
VFLLDVILLAFMLDWKKALLHVINHSRNILNPVMNFFRDCSAHIDSRS